MPGWKHDVGTALDELIERVVPDVRRAVRWNSPFYGVEGQGWFLSFHCFTRYVKVTWLNGADLRPPPPEASKQGRARSLHIGEEDPMDEEQLRAWLRQAATLGGEPLF